MLANALDPTSPDEPTPSCQTPLAQTLQGQTQKQAGVLQAEEALTPAVPAGSNVSDEFLLLLSLTNELIVTDLTIYD